MTLTRFIYSGVVTFAITITGFFGAHGQGNQPTTEQKNAPLGYLDKASIIPPAPEAASLGQYGNVPVSLYNGRINFGVPIYTVKGKELALPISLSYNSGGFKVGEDPGWVGLGWTLNAGGVITRSAVGRPDQCDTYYSKKSEILTGSTTTDERQRQDFYEKINKGFLETQPDAYFFNFSDLSGKFFINMDKEVILIDNKPVTISFANLCDDQGNVTVKGPDGTMYYFQDKETTDLTYDDENLQSTIDHYVYTSSWYLSKIISANALDTINFTYTALPAMPMAITPNPESVSYTFHGPTSKSGSGLTPPCGEMNGPTILNTGSDTKISRVFLSSIKYKKMEILFSISNNGSDFGGKKLDEIIVKDRGLQVKKVVFGNSYFDAPSVPNDRRLRLDFITEFGPNGQVSPPYEFTYSDILLPAINSKEIDHWGYYNASGNTWLLPSFTSGDCTYGMDANREASENAVGAASLIKVKYPTGGSTQFSYAKHLKKEAGMEEGPLAWVDIDHRISFDLEGLPPFGGLYPSGPCAGSPKIDVFEFSIPDTAARVSFNFPTAQWDEQVHGEGAKAFVGVIRASEFNFTGCDLFGYVNANIGKFDHYWYLESDAYSVSAATTLIPGTYKFVRVNEFASLNLQPEVVFYTKELRQTNQYFPQQVVGGQRIQTVNDYNDLGEMISSKQYEYDLAKSFGDPTYVNLSTYFFEAPIAQEQGGQLIDYMSWTVNISSQSGAVLGTIMGSHVGYGKVTERFTGPQGASNGHKIFYYRNSATEGAGSGLGLELDDYGQGDLLREEVYDTNDNLVQETLHEYSNDVGESRYSSAVSGLIVRGASAQSNQLSLAELLNVPGVYKWFYEFNEVAGDNLSIVNRKLFKVKNIASGYLIHGHWHYLSKTTKIDHVGNDEPVITYEKNTYDNLVHLLPTKVERKDSKNQIKYTDYLYSSDGIPGLSTTAWQALNALQSKTTLIQTNVRNQSGQFLSSQRVDYELVGGKPFPKDIYFSESTLPFAANDLQYVLKKRATYTYNNQGDLIEYAKVNDVKQSFVWSSDHRQVLAEVTGAAASDIAYTSFENTSGEGNWSFTPGFYFLASKTGKRSHLLSGNSLTRAVQASTVYLLTFWAKDGVPSVNAVTLSEDDAAPGADGWKFYKKTITGTGLVTISGTGQTLIDEVRLHPKNSQMTSFVYDVQFGLSNSSDVNGTISSFEYYPNGRLKLTRDYQGNILKSHIYHYKGEN